jgi:hypothetical protein
VIEPIHPLFLLLIAEDEEENQENQENQENHQIKRGNKEKLKEEDINIFRKYQFLFYKCKFYKDII